MLRSTSHICDTTPFTAVSVLTKVNRLFVFPPTCTIVLSIRLTPWQGALADPVYTSNHAALADILTPCIRAALQDAVAMTVSCGDGHFAVRIPESGAAAPRGGVNVFYHGCWGIELNMPRPTFGAFVPFCPSDRLTSLTFGRVKETYPAAKWAAVFRAYPTLQRITLAEAHSDVSGVFMALAPSARPREGAGEDRDEDSNEDDDDGRLAQELLCPALRHIEVRLCMRTSKGLSRLAGTMVRCAAPRAEGRGGAQRLVSLTVVWEHRREAAARCSDPEPWEPVVEKLRILVDEVNFNVQHVRK